MTNEILRVIIASTTEHSNGGVVARISQGDIDSVASQHPGIYAWLVLNNETHVLHKAIAVHGVFFIFSLKYSTGIALCSTRFFLLIKRKGR